MNVSLPKAGVRDRSQLDRRLSEAERLLRSCTLCEHRCHTDRTKDERGCCGCGAESRVYLEDLLWSEEECITPSYAVFFAGCNMRCGFCYAAEHNRHPERCLPVDARAVAERAAECSPRPASFSFIGGEPTVHLATALRIAAELPADLPLVWNSNFYFSDETAALLDGVIAVFVADIHFGNERCARDLGGAERYLRVLSRNTLRARDMGALLLRHLVVPGHVECCTAPALRWIAAEMPETPVHLMTNYLPPESRLMTGLARSLGDDEGVRARALFESLGLRSVQ